MVLQWSLLWAHERLPLTLLIDSGADVVDEKLARQAGLPLVKLTEPKLLLDLDGRTLVSSIYQTNTVMLVVSGNHGEGIQLYLISSSSAPAILGSPWLTRHSPQIDWSTGSLTGWSEACHSHCLYSTLPPAPLVSVSALVPADLSIIPEVYHELTEVFS